MMYVCVCVMGPLLRSREGSERLGPGEVYALPFTCREEPPVQASRSLLYPEGAATSEGEMTYATFNSGPPVEQFQNV